VWRWIDELGGKDNVKFTTPKFISFLLLPTASDNCGFLASFIITLQSGAEPKFEIAPSIFGVFVEPSVSLARGEKENRLRMKGQMPFCAPRTKPAGRVKAGESGFPKGAIKWHGENV
jgi:hypothetical protein